MDEEFKAITTQEEFNTAIKDRLKRERDTVSKQYEGWISPDDYNKQTADLQKSIDDYAKKSTDYEEQISRLTAANKKYETDSVKTRVALSKGLPIGMASRLNGETEEEITKDADALSAFFKPAKQTAPMATAEPEPKDDGKASLRELVQSMKR